MSDMPGKEFAEKNGFTLQWYNGAAKTAATYIKHVNDEQTAAIFLTVKADGTAELSATWHMITLSSGYFGLPNANYMYFERDMTQAILALVKADEERRQRYLEQAEAISWPIGM